MNINIGDLNQRISFFKELPKYGPEPGPGEIVELGSTWAHVSNLHGDEYYTAYGYSLEKELKFIIRYRSDVTEKTTIKFNGKTYNITFIDNIRYRNRFMEIRASQRG